MKIFKKIKNYQREIKLTKKHSEFFWFFKNYWFLKIIDYKGRSIFQFFETCRYWFLKLRIELVNKSIC